MDPIIETIEEYNFCKTRGHDPLVSPHLKMDHSFRVTMQKKVFGHCIFGRGDIPQANQRYYLYVWDNKKHYCENCQAPLQEYAAKFISHIFTKGGFPEMAHDPRNSNILCLKCHNKWEFGTEKDRKRMRIYPSNLIVIEMLKKAYLVT